MPNNKWFLAFLSGFLLALPWYENISGIVLHFAFVPLFIATDNINFKRSIYSNLQVFGVIFLAFFTWNVVSMWWVYKISFTGAVFVITANSVLYTLVFRLWLWFRKVSGELYGWIFFPFVWLAFEYYCFHFGFAQPWLLLGNGMASDIRLVQWYEYTGVLGGSLWVLMVNILIYFIYRNYINLKYYNTLVLSGIVLLTWVIPYVMSVVIFNRIEAQGHTCRVALLQPNIDPYTEKFNGLSQTEQLAILIHLADSVKDDAIDYYLAPETAIDNEVWETRLNTNYSIFKIREFIWKQPKAAFVIGAITYIENKTEEERRSYTRFNEKDSIYYDVFNSALQIDTTFNESIYHKSKLVLGVERSLFEGASHFLNKYLLKLGGTDGNLGRQNEPEVFTHSGGLFYPAPVICFESVYGEYVTEYIQKGANLIFILTNDGWWKNTPGYKQHLRFSQIRAVETRRSVARSANTGVSAFIDTRGIITNSTNWWVPAAIKGKIHTNSRITFYAKHGDYIGRWAMYILAVLGVGFILFSVRNKIIKNENPKNRLRE